MKKLDEEFRIHGYDYKLKKRTEGTVMYNVARNGVSVGYEVWRVKIEEPSVRTFGNETVQLPRREIKPHTDNSFGKWAWAYKSYTKANERYQELSELPPITKKQLCSHVD